MCPISKKIARQVSDEGYRHVVHMGMGGSSLTPLVFQQSFVTGKTAWRSGFWIRPIQRQYLKSNARFHLVRLFLSWPRSPATTAEPLAFGDYFYDKVKSLKGDRAGENFVAITDPGSPLVDLARNRKSLFRRVFLNFEDIGGRYSALSYFGILPAALMGLDVGELIERALRMEHACASGISF